MSNKDSILKDEKIKEKYFLDEDIFVGEGDELVPNCEGGPCNYVYRVVNEE